MKRDQILETIKRLGQSQGMYGRLYSNLSCMQELCPEKFDKIMTEMEQENFEGPVDLVIWLET